MSLDATIGAELRPKDHAGFMTAGQCDNKASLRAPETVARKVEMAGVALKSRVDQVRILAGGAALALLLALTGCGSFFQCEGKSDCPASSTGTGSGTGSGSDYVYVSNSSSGSTYLNGYEISSGALTATSGSPYQLDFSPVAMAITPNDSYLYISNGAAGSIYGYSIGTGGALSILSSGSALESEDCAAIAISPDGQWLFSLNMNDLTVEEYSIASSGALSYVANYQITNSYSGAILSSGIQVAPSGNFIAVALGPAGTEIFSFNTSTGVAAYASQINAAASASGDYAVAIDSSNNLYVAATNELYRFSVTSSGTPTQVSTSSTGTGPYSIALDSTSYVYSGSENATSSPIISGFIASTSNPMAQVSGSPIAAPTDIAAMGVDKTNTYLVTAGYNSTSGVQLFSIGSAGALTSVGTAATGTSLSIPTVMALTH